MTRMRVSMKTIKNQSIVTVFGLIMSWELEAQNTTISLIVGPSLLAFPDMHE